MKTIDTNILVYGHREEFDRHNKALSLIKELCEGDEPIIILWPCIYEFLRIVTHSRLFYPPTPLSLALEAIEGILNSPCIITVGETRRHITCLNEMTSKGSCKGNLVFDAHIAALMKEHGIDEILTTDKDFHRFPGLTVTDPFQSGD